MNEQVFVSLVVLATLIGISAAKPQIQQREAEAELYCADGWFCQCSQYLDEGGYRGARHTVQCLESLGIPHDFSNASSDTFVSHQACEKYVGDFINTTQMRICVFKKAGLVHDVDGVDQWNLPLCRKVLIFAFTSKFPGPEAAWVREIIVTTFTVCQADPTNFDVMPFEKCWERALQLIIDLNDIADKDNKNVSNEGTNLLKNDALALVSLKSTSEDLTMSANLDISKLL